MHASVMRCGAGGKDKRPTITAFCALAREDPSSRRSTARSKQSSCTYVLRLHRTSACQAGRLQSRAVRRRRRAARCLTGRRVVSAFASVCWYGSTGGCPTSAINLPAVRGPWTCSAIALISRGSYQRRDEASLAASLRYGFSAPSNASSSRGARLPCPSASAIKTTQCLGNVAPLIYWRAAVASRWTPAS